MIKAGGSVPLSEKGRRKGDRPFYILEYVLIGKGRKTFQEGFGVLMAASFMIIGPGTKITNLGVQNFLLYLAFVIVFSLGTGLMVNGIGL